MADKRFLVNLDREEQPQEQTQFETATPNFDGHETRSLTDRFVQLDGTIKKYILIDDVPLPVSGAKLVFDGTDWIPFYNSVMQVRNTNTTTDIEINTGDFTTQVPIGGVAQSFNDPNTDFTLAGETVVCNFTGVVKISAHVHIDTASARSAFQIRARIGSTPVGPIGASGYVRNASGHQESSNTIPAFFANVTSGDIIDLGSRIEGANGNTQMQRAGSSMLLVERV